MSSETRTGPHPRIQVESRIRIVLAAAMLLTAAACGAKGPPRPPLPKVPEPVKGLSLRQSGERLELRWSPPARRENGEKLDGAVGYVVLARAVERPPEPPGPASNLPHGAPPQPGRTSSSGAPPTFTRAEEEAFARSATVVARVAATMRPGPRGEFTEILTPSSFPGERLTRARLELSVIAVDAKGRRSRPHPVLVIDPVAALPPPEGLEAEPVREGIRLTWRLPTGVPSIGIDIYRARLPGEGEAAAAGVATKDAGTVAEGLLPQVLLPGSPFGGEGMVDGSARLGEIYIYEARTRGTGPGLGTRESVPTSAVRVDYQDRFPPGPPGLVTAEALLTPAGEGAGSEGSLAIKVSWSPPLDTDVAGYRVYRSSAGGEFSCIGEVAASETSWIDRSVAAGARYVYRVAAIDVAHSPNESGRSEEAEVVVDAPVPPQ